MKNINSILFIATTILLMADSGCKKEKAMPDQSTPVQPPRANTAPISNAGPDQALLLPINYCTLYGNGYDPENNIRTVLWSKISGPPSFLVEHADSLSTRLSNLEIGVYEFTLTVTDSLGLFGKDTVKVTVTAATISANATWTIKAGTDKLVYYPTNFTQLSANLSGGTINNQTILWSKVSGPSSFFIETPNSLGTKVTNLQIGIYRFEVRIWNNVGVLDKDTCTVIVGQLPDSPKEILFTNQVWVQDGLLWGSGITIKNVYQNLPAGSVFRVYIRKDNSVNWEELLMEDYNALYEFYLSKGDLYIYSNYDETDTPDIKLVY